MGQRKTCRSPLRRGTLQVKIHRLDLIAFGHFTNRTIEFYPPIVQLDKKNSHGVHIIYGPNEAGKSSSLRALTAWLFGFPARTEDGFLHSYQNLRVGGLLANQQGETLACIRRKGNNNTLRDQDDSAIIPSETLSKFLPKVDEKQFLRMFGIDHDTLREGGEELARGGGESGQALFASASGLNNLTLSKQHLDEATETILSKSGRKGKLLEKIKLYEKLAKEERDAEISLEEWTKLDQEIADATSNYNSIKKRLAEKRLRNLTIDRYQSALPTAKRTLDKTSDIEKLGSIPASLKASEDFQTFEVKLQNTLQELATNQASLQDLKNECDHLEEELKRIPDAAWSVEHEQQIIDVIAELGVYRKAIQEVPNLEAEQQSHRKSIKTIWLELGQLDGLRTRLDSTRLPTHEKKRIEQLARQYEDLQRNVQSLEDQIQKRRQRIERNKTENSKTISPFDFATLEQIQKRYNLEIDRQRDTQELTNVTQSLRQSILRNAEKLRIELANDPNESIEQLAKRSLPPISHLERWAKEETKRLDQIAKIKQNRDELQDKHQAKKLAADREIDKSNLPTHEDWAVAKQTRDNAFVLLLESNPQNKDVWSELIETYRQRRDQADQIANDLLTHADRVATREKLLESLEDLRQQIDRESEKLQRELAAHDLWTTDWNNFLQSNSLPCQSPETVIAWVQDLSETQRQAQEYLAKETQRTRAQESLLQCTREAQKQLLAVGAHCPPDSSAEQTLFLVQHWLETARNLKASNEAREKQNAQEIDEVQDLLDDLQTKQQYFQDIQQKWWDSLTALAIPKDATPEQTQTILSQISDLQSFTDSLASIEHKLQENQTFIQKYQNKVGSVFATCTALASILPTPQQDESTQQKGIQTELAVQALEREKNQAETNRTTRANLTSQLQKVRKKSDDAVCVQERLEYDIASLMKTIQATTLEELKETSLRVRQYHHLEAQRIELRNLLYQSCDEPDLDTFIEKIQSLNPDDLKLERQELENDIERLETEEKEVLQQQTKLQEQQRQLDISGRASQLATEAKGVAAEIEEYIQELAILRMASAALITGIEKYRQENEDPILKRASEMFRSLTLQRYQAIEIDIEESGKHILVGRRNENGSPVRVTLEKMSDGTRDQFFLALRLASIGQWNTTHDPMPLIVDDILVHFDDQRAAATLRQLALLSAKTQVIFFTHHQHLVDLAKETIPQDSLFVHQL